LKAGLTLEKSSSDSKPVALVTGASSGIGAEFARQLAQRGYNVILVARRADKLQQIQRDTGGEILVADLASDAGLDAVEARIRRANDIDFLVNNAGFGTLGVFWNAKDQDTMHRVHVLATVRITHAALQGMIARDRGTVVNVSSVAGFSQNILNVSYCATKGWMNSFSEGLRLELRTVPLRIRVQALCPGFTRSEFHDTLGIDKRKIPESLWMSAEEVVAASFRALERNALFVVPGWRYKIWVAMQRYLPRALIHAIAASSAPEFKKVKDA
jgi:short-subunit dehydrogenase